MSLVVLANLLLRTDELCGWALYLTVSHNECSGYGRIHSNALQITSYVAVATAILEHLSNT